MADKLDSVLILGLNDEAATLEMVGGKGESLARMARAGLPVPMGFHVTTQAYLDFVAGARLSARLTRALEGVDPEQPGSADSAAATIRGLFMGAPFPVSTADAICKAYAELGTDSPVAVRSSATAEDLPDMSFAGQQDTYLNVRGQDALIAAVRDCWASLWSGRAIMYRLQNRVQNDDIAIAVVVQRMVAADAAGVMFTADPITRGRDRIVINAAWGLGESIVGGTVTPDSIVVDRQSRRVVEQQIADKTVMTVLQPTGTVEVPVPAHRRSKAVLRPRDIESLTRLAESVDALYGQPMDVEWARESGRLHMLQARPITAMDPLADLLAEWNDSLGGDYLWSNANLGEAVPDVMTPCSWSLIQKFMTDAMAGPDIAGHRLYGRIGGRFYMNISLMATTAAAFGQGKRLAQANEQVFGRLPGAEDIPLIPVSRWKIMKQTVPIGIAQQRRVRSNHKHLDDLLRSSPAACEELRRLIVGVQDPNTLASLWHDRVAPHFQLACGMLETATKNNANRLVSVPAKLRRLVGDAESNALTSGLEGAGGQLASLDPLLGLQRLANGEIDRATYASKYGHRGPHEFEVSLPRPAEDPGWIDKLIDGLTGTDVTQLLRSQAEAGSAAWERLRAAHPRRVARLHALADKWAQQAREREAARSEVIRAFWVLRTFALRAGDLLALGDDIFFLSVEEILAALVGDHSCFEHIQLRKTAYATLLALPPYPAMIRGPFDPVRWAADPHRRSDSYSADGSNQPTRFTVSGFAGAAGVVEGVARVVLTVEEAASLLPGEILVTTSTNVGWTPLFPRAAAVVTDVGAPLSHAAIVARELGIPAVVGCGNATMRIATGDRIRVDGSAGVVDLISSGREVTAS